MSVTFAPRARMAVNASWPGVSRKVTLRPSTSTWYAPMCCVIPPASVSTTAVSRIASRSEVLPWSTWPMIVTTGGRGWRSFSSSTNSSGSSSSAACLMMISRSTSAAISSTASSESDWVICTISPSPIMILMICAAGIPSACERSRTVTPDGTVTGPVGATTGCAGPLVSRRSPRPWRWSRPPGALPPWSMTTRRLPRAGTGAAGPDRSIRSLLGHQSVLQCRGPRVPDRRAPSVAACARTPAATARARSTRAAGRCRRRGRRRAATASGCPPARRSAGAPAAAPSARSRRTS